MTLFNTDKSRNC